MEDNKYKLSCKSCGGVLSEDHPYFLINTGHTDEVGALCHRCTVEYVKEFEGDDLIITDSSGEVVHMCSFCTGFYSDDELRKEKDMGLLCEHCVQSLISRGEELWFRHRGNL